MGKKTGLSILVLVISACALLSIGLIVGGVFLLKAQKNYTPPTPVTVVATPQIDPQIDPLITAVPNEIPADISRQMDEIEQQVSPIRGLDLLDTLDRNLMTPDELREKVVNDFFADYTDEDARQDVLVLSVLGLMDAGFDLKQFYHDLYSEQIAGFYDSETKEMYVIVNDGFGGMERITYAHEFNHALQDQNYDLENGLMLNDEKCEIDTEYCAAVSALVEGDATSLEYAWFYEHGTKQDYEDITNFQNSYESPIYDSAPAFMQEDFLFPYSYGYDFVQVLINKDGWTAVDAAFANPPVSTEQILHPERYPDDKPIPIELPDLTPDLDGGWQEIERNVMGEWYTYLILAKGRTEGFMMDEDKSRAAAEGWGGDTYAFYTTPDLSQYLIAWHSTWDSQQDAQELFDLSHDYGLARWGIPTQKSNGVVVWDSEVDGRITMRLSGADVLWLIGSSEPLVKEALVDIGSFGK